MVLCKYKLVLEQYDGSDFNDYSCI